MASSSISKSISPSISSTTSPSSTLSPSSSTSPSKTPSSTKSVSISSTLSPSASVSPSPGAETDLTWPRAGSEYIEAIDDYSVFNIEAVGVEGGLAPSLVIPIRTLVAEGSNSGAFVDDDRPICTCESYAGSPFVNVERPFYTIEAAGDTDILANVDVVAAARTIEAYGNFISVSTAPSRTITAHGYTGEAGLLDELVPGRTITAIAGGLVIATVDEVVPGRTITAHDWLSFAGTLACDMPVRTLSSSGLTGEIGTLDFDRSVYTIEALGSTVLHAVVVTDRGFYTIDAGTLTFITVGTEQLTSFALGMNVKQGANYEYDNYAFESLAMFNGKPFGANSGGLYELAGEDDAGTDISAEIETGKTDFEVGNVKKPWSLHLGMYGTGTVRAKLKGARSVEITGKDARIQEGSLKIKHSRDTRSSYWGVSLKNLEGADFQLNNIDLVIETLGRREDY